MRVITVGVGGECSNTAAAAQWPGILVRKDSVFSDDFTDKCTYFLKVRCTIHII